MHESDLLLHLHGGVEVDVLMTACNDVGPDFRTERRAVRELTDVSIAPTRSPENLPELWLTRDMAWLAVRVIRRFAERLPYLPEGIPAAVMLGAIAMGDELAAIDPVLRNPSVES